MKTEDIRRMAQAWKKVQEAVKKKLDPVDADELKGSHADRADKDIDNDGDADKSDEYLHKRRKAVSKAIKGKGTETEIQTQESVEELDEISKTKMGQYIKRAHSDKDTQKKRASIFDKKGMDADKDNDMYKQFSIADRARKKAANRTKFIGKAVDKLTKEAKDHGNTTNGSPAGEGLSPSAKKELDRKTPMPAFVDEPEIDKKTFDAIRASGKKAAARPGDGKIGDKNIMAKTIDITAKAAKQP